MTSLYDNYSTQTGASTLDHRADVARVAEHYRQHLLPLIEKRVRLSHCLFFEFGAGWGRNLLALSTLGATDVRGVDISVEQVELGRKLGLERLEHVSVDTDLVARLGKHKFDVVLAIDVLEHLHLDALHEFTKFVRHITKPGGLLVVQVPNALAPLNPVTAGDLTHLRAFTPASLRQVFELAGVEPLHILGISFPTASRGGWLRAWVARTVVLRVARLVSFILYGRSRDPLYVDPNLLGVAVMRAENDQ